MFYINAYSETRHYGGPEEGGWWYNHLEPLASIPIEAEEDDQGIITPKDQLQFDVQCDYLRETLSEYEYGDIYSVRGGSELAIIIQDHIAEEEPKYRPRYE